MKQFFLTNETYGDGFVLEEYKGEYRLIAARQGKEKVWEKWGDIEIGKDKTKRLPVSVSLGTDPVATLERVISYLNYLKTPF